MEVQKLKTPLINQNGYHKNVLTKERIGALFIYPIDYTPDDCLSCDGYSLLISDYEELYKIIGAKFNQAGDLEGTFRIPDYNVTGRFLQPGANVGNQIAAGIPNIWGEFGCYQNGYISGGYVANGAFYVANGWAWAKASAGDTGSRSIVYGYNAARCSGVYGASATVQPNSQIVHICIKYK